MTNHQSPNVKDIIFRKYIIYCINQTTRLLIN